MNKAQFELHAEIESSHWWFVGRRMIVSRLVEQLTRDKSLTTLVDIGCGTGANIAAFGNNFECTGIDTSEDAIRLARNRFPSVNFVHGPAPESITDIVSGTDVFLLMDVLEHIEDDQEFLSKLVGSAAPGAKIVVTVPAGMELWSKHDVSFGHYRRYSIGELRKLWDTLPVRELLVSHFNSRLYPIVRAVRSLNRLTHKSTRGTAGTDFTVPPAPVNRALTHIFAGESTRLLESLGSGHVSTFKRGVSIIAILELTSH